MVIFAKVTGPGQSLVVVSFKQLDVQLYFASHDKPRPVGISKTDRDRKPFPQFGFELSQVQAVQEDNLQSTI